MKSNVFQKHVSEYQKLEFRIIKNLFPEKRLQIVSDTNILKAEQRRQNIFCITYFMRKM